MKGFRHSCSETYTNLPTQVIVSDSGNHRVQVFDKYGRFLFKFGREGSADGLFKYPRGVAVDRHGNIVIGDSGNNRVQVLLCVVLKDALVVLL